MSERERKLVDWARLSSNDAEIRELARLFESRLDAEEGLVGGIGLSLTLFRDACVMVNVEGSDPQRAHILYIKNNIDNLIKGYRQLLAERDEARRAKDRLASANDDLQTQETGR